MFEVWLWKIIDYIEDLVKKFGATLTVVLLIVPFGIPVLVALVLLKRRKARLKLPQS